MVDTITIEQFKKLDPNQTFTSCLEVKVTELSLPSSGETKGRKWSRQALAITDATGTLKLSLFNGHIGKMILGKVYQICEMGIDTFNGYNTPKVLAKTTIKEIESSNTEFLKQKQKEIQSKPKQAISDDIIEFVNSEYPVVHGIETALLSLNPDLEKNGQRLGLYINNLYSAWQKRNEKQ